jgi:hypothetical protein
MDNFIEKQRSRIITYENQIIVYGFQKKYGFKRKPVIFSGCGVQIPLWEVINLIGDISVEQKLTEFQDLNVSIEKHRVIINFVSRLGPVYIYILDNREKALKEEQIFHEDGYEIIHYTNDKNTFKLVKVDM